MRTQGNMKYIELKQHLGNALNGEEKLKSVYVVGGDDEYLRQQASKMFKQMVSADFAEFNFTVTSNVDEAIDVAYMFPMFEEKRVVVLVFEDSPTSDELEKFKSYVSAPVDTAIFVVSCDKDALKNVKMKGTTFVDCAHLDEESLKVEVEALLQSAPKCTIERSALLELAMRTQNNMARIASEIAKLKCYVDGAISLADVKEMVVADLEFQTYELSSAVSDKDANKALEIITSFKKQDIKGHTVVGLLYDRYRKMLHAELNKSKTNDEIAEILGMKSGAVYYLRKTSQNYSQVRLKKCVDYLHALQEDILTGKQNDENVLHIAILQLLAI